MIVSALKYALKFLSPLGVLWLALLVIAVWLWRTGQRKPARWMLALWVLLTALTCVPVSDRLLAHIEGPWRDALSHVDQWPTADAILCLGGGVEPSDVELIGLNMQDNSDRPMTAVELLRRGKAPMLIISGGGVGCTKYGEAAAVRHWVQHWNLAQQDVETLPPCKDTHDEAIALGVIAKERGWKRVILVTSASHLTRATAVFRTNAGVEIVPSPCAFMTKPSPTEWVHAPEIDGFRAFDTWFHEVAGWWVYRLRGWIKA